MCVLLGFWTFAEPQKQNTYPTNERRFVKITEKKHNCNNFSILSGHHLGGWPAESLSSLVAGGCHTAIVCVIAMTYLM